MPAMMRAAESPKKAKIQSVRNKRTTRSKTQKLLMALERLDLDSVSDLIIDDKFDLSLISPSQLELVLWQAVKKQNALLVRELLKYKSVEKKMLLLAIKQFDIEIAMMLLEAGADVKEDFYLHMIAACRSRKMHDLFVPLIEHGADINQIDRYGKSVVHYAIKTGAVDLIQELLVRGCHIVPTDRLSIPVLPNTKKAFEILEMLARYSYIDTQMRDNYALGTIFYLISKSTLNEDAIRGLLAFGVNINTLNKTLNLSPLHYAAGTNKFDAVKLLLDHGADVNCRTKINMTPLSFASCLRQPHIAALLIERGANLHLFNNRGRYPIHMACFQNAPLVTQLLILSGANFNVTDECDITPFAFARESRTEQINILLKHFAYLSSKGISINNADLAAIRKSSLKSQIYHTCLKELERMKNTDIVSNITYYHLLSRKFGKLIRHAKNPNVVRAFREGKRLGDGQKIIWEKYSSDLDIAFKLTEKLRDLLIEREKELLEVFRGVLPAIVIFEIARLELFDELPTIERKFNLSLFSKVEGD